MSRPRWQTTLLIWLLRIFFALASLLAYSDSMYLTAAAFAMCSATVRRNDL